MKIYFITGNKQKFAEACLVLPELEQLEIDLPEIQSLDSEVIIRAKLEEAFKHHAGPFVVEDNSLHLECLSGLPGPLIKWFLQTIGSDGLADLAAKYNNSKAKARVMIGYAQDRGNVHFFAGEVDGDIVPRETSEGFGWDVIFRPRGHEHTFSTMTDAEKNQISMRGQAFSHLKQFLNNSR